MAKPKTEKKKGYMPRHKEEHPGLNFRRMVKNRQEVVEGIDYLDQLSPKELDWMNSFIEETVIGNFKHKGKKLIKSQKKKREIWRENNYRNVDMLSMARATGLLRHDINLSAYIESQQNLDPSNVEDLLIQKLAEKNQLVDEAPVKPSKAKKKPKKKK